MSKLNEFQRRDLIDRLKMEMSRAAEALEFEKAARYRDEITELRKMELEEA